MNYLPVCKININIKSKIIEDRTEMKNNYDLSQVLVKEAIAIVLRLRIHGVRKGVRKEDKFLQGVSNWD